jgi:hypothetical protein
MVVTRVLNLRQYDRRSRRFRDLVYKNSSPEPGQPAPDGRGGLSVVETACACGALNGRCICEHIARYYAHVAPEPFAFWTFDTDDFLPPTPNPNKISPPVILPTPSDTGDACHRNVHFISDNRLEKAFRKAEAEFEFSVCVGGNVEAYTPDRAIELHQIHYPDPV